MIKEIRKEKMDNREACRLFELLCFNLLYVYNASLHQSILDAIANADASHKSSKEQTKYQYFQDEKLRKMRKSCELYLH